MPRKKVYEECHPPHNIHVDNDELIVANEDNFIVIGENSMYKDGGDYTYVGDRLAYAYIHSLPNEQHFKVLQDVVCDYTGALFVVHEEVIQHLGIPNDELCLYGVGLYDMVRSVPYTGRIGPWTGVDIFEDYAATLLWI